LKEERTQEKGNPNRAITSGKRGHGKRESPERWLWKALGRKLNRGETKVQKLEDTCGKSSEKKIGKVV